MKILYIAGAINLADRSGGATHVREVAEELAARGHELFVVARASDPSEIVAWGWTVGGEHATAKQPAIRKHSVTLYQAALPDKVALFAFPAITGLARELDVDVIMERYYNFAGAGAVTARQLGLPLVLEVNAPMVDPPGSLKSKLDRLTLNSMQRWTITQARQAQRIVTPLNTTVPSAISRSKIVELPWGANVGRFDPDLRTEHRSELARLRGRLGIPTDATVAVFVGVAGRPAIGPQVPVRLRG